jgi:cysteinyl-tRNA synthetase
VDGGVNLYFDVSSFPGYGKLSGNKIEDLNPGARIEVRDEKKHPADFALWIYNPNHLMQWEAPWGSGYPGWHLECSAMAMKYLGDTIDIHTGGEDNKFPHHECEIAQSECATGKSFANNWLHVTHLMVEGKKMSKSQGNYLTLDDLTAKGYEPRTVRYLLISAHYRQSLNFTFQGLDSAKSALARLDNFNDALSEYSAKEGGDGKSVKAAMKGVEKALDDDLNVSEALAVAFDLVRSVNDKMAGGELGRKDKMAAEEFMKELGQMLGFTFGRTSSDEGTPKSILELVERRDQARAEKRFAEADKLRDQMAEQGFVIEDTDKGTKVKRA